MLLEVINMDIPRTLKYMRHILMKALSEKRIGDDIEYPMKWEDDYGKYEMVNRTRVNVQPKQATQILNLKFKILKSGDLEQINGELEK